MRDTDSNDQQDLRAGQYSELENLAFLIAREFVKESERQLADRMLADLKQTKFKPKARKVGRG